ncbi:MAG: tyrosine decarboxylase MfnA [Candidatus Freyarchaeota archaeon]|nr:tyrosine decarboxylase MfnA [Candidatus Jordarchaeia archaeon]MBS7270184.1 tyrosine decarboxylase MfnA [Candidatus Jordarchaeia archaeon]MBS7279718.1 tyrosine decarboxylase MfnA [Candidatus Jordarchaeia archaeon]
MRVKSLNQSGVPPEKILEELSEKLNKDLTYESGKILGSMCTIPHDLARKLMTMYLEKNLGDPGLFKGTQEIEIETIKMLGNLLNNPKSWGYIVSGGTEGNIVAMRIARNIGRKKIRGGTPEIIIPTSAHASFDKAADLLGIRLVRVNLDREYRVKPSEVKKAITDKTIAIVGIAGTTSLGTIDPIEELSEIALEKNLYLHIDAAFGGMVIPFLERLGYKLPKFDFRNQGVCSITVDPHKMGLAPIPAGGILFKDRTYILENCFEIPYLAGGTYAHPIILGTRSGAAVIATWATLKHLGIEGYTQIVKNCMEVTHQLEKGIQQIKNVELATKPIMNIVGITSKKLDICQIDQELRKLRWALGKFENLLRIVVMPHVKPQHIQQFLTDLEQIIKKIK